MQKQEKYEESDSNEIFIDPVPSDTFSIGNGSIWATIILRMLATVFLICHSYISNRQEGPTSHARSTLNPSEQNPL